ncbi:hypothetical protein P7K49_028039, partial [Saguinus oedipus]
AGVGQATAGRPRGLIFTRSPRPAGVGSWGRAPPLPGAHPRPCVQLPCAPRSPRPPRRPQPRRRTPTPVPGLAFAAVKPGRLGRSSDDLCSARRRRRLLLWLLLLSSERRRRRRRLPCYGRVICVPAAG